MAQELDTPINTLHSEKGRGKPLMLNMTNGKAAEKDIITGDMLKIDITITDIMLLLIQKSPREEVFPQVGKKE